MVQQILVLLIVLACVLFMLLYMKKALNHHDCQCGCSCDCQEHRDCRGCTAGCQEDRSGCACPEQNAGECSCKESCPCGCRDGNSQVLGKEE